MLFIEYECIIFKNLILACTNGPYAHTEDTKYCHYRNHEQNTVLYPQKYPDDIDPVFLCGFFGYCGLPFAAGRPVYV
jgi:hypothetical protein